MESEYVYHGSHELFEIAQPKRSKRTRIENGESKTIFDDIAFHATPYRWIALAYTYNPKKVFELSGENIYYNMGVSLYENDKKVIIHGTNSLKESLDILYEDGGYILGFYKNKFFHTEGLGNLEVITKEPTKPDVIEKIENPVEEMMKEGVEFIFLDLTIPENARFRNHKRSNSVH